MLMGTYVDICIVTLPNAECDFEEDDVDASEVMTGDDMLVLSGHIHLIAMNNYSYSLQNTLNGGGGGDIVL